MHATSLLAAAVLAGSAMAALSINTPASLVECQPASLVFSDGTSPYIIAAIPGGEVSSAAIETITDDVTSSPYTWTVNLASGTNITLKITDSTGTIAYSSPVVVQAGSSESCLNTTASTSGLSSASVTSTSTDSSTTAAGVAATTSGSSSADSSSSASSSSTESSSSAASSSASSSSATSSSAAASTTSASATSSDASTSSAASTSSSSSGAMANSIVAVPALLAGVVAGVAAFL